MKTYSFVFLFLINASVSYAQVSISGKIIDQTEALPFTTVILLDLDSIMVQGMVTDVSGSFSFDKVARGQYRIAASMIGYGSYYSEVLMVDDHAISLPDILLKESITELNEFIVKAEKPLFEQRPDRLIINVQSSATSSGNTILEVLQKAPGVLVNKQASTISISGKSGVRIMINGKIMQVSQDVVMQMLEGMPSSNIEKIELIMAPPSKYDAEGNAGIINIVTKQNPDLGTAGSFGLTLGAHWAEMAGANLNLSHRGKRVAWFLDYSGIRNHNLHSSDISRRSIDGSFIQSISDRSHRENVTTQQNLNAGLEWNVSDNSVLNFGVTAYRRNWTLDAMAHDINYAASDSTVTTELDITELNLWQSATATMGWQTRISPKSELSFNFDYLYYRNDNPSHYNNETHYEEQELTEVSEIDLKKVTPITFYIGRVDYQYSVSPSLTIESGLKGVASHLNNNVIVDRLINNTWQPDPNFTSYAALDEQIAAGYISARWLVNPQWLVNSGVRYEYTHTAIRSPTQGNLVNRKYGYFFPSLSVEKKLNEESNVQLSFARRITRPTYNDIAPYVFFWGPNIFSSGNTSLYPSVSNNLRLSYQLKNWTTAVQATRSYREINFYQPEIDSKTNGLIYRSQNMKYLDTYSFTNTYSLALFSWWEMQGTVTGLYQFLKATSQQSDLSLDLYSFNLNFLSVIKLSGNWSIEMSGFYQSKSLVGITNWLPMASLNAGIQKKIGKNGSLTLAMDDVLYTNRWRIHTNSSSQNFVSDFNYDFHNQFVRVSYTHNLGNLKLRSIRLKSGAEEERKRVN